ncbi:MAG: Z1 domain-containing protein [Coriobacteriia bacterium]|nr:Z1 domain-containing protein [Coriobacteriia bacterium]
MSRNDLNQSAVDNFIEMVTISPLVRDRLPSKEELALAIDQALEAAPMFDIALTEGEEELARRKLLVMINVEKSVGYALDDKAQDSWLPQSKQAIDFYYWERYKKYTLRSGLPIRVIQMLDAETDRILNLCGDPNRKDSWERVGLVMGDVQSGKTGNYTGLICKAADAGYRVIIVIAGIQDNLRSQTQMRIDAGFTGFDSARHDGGIAVKGSVAIGVGRIHTSVTRRPSSWTNTKQDFNKIKKSIGVDLENHPEPYVFVIKKNVAVLKNLIDWLKMNNVHGANERIESPLLLIDDEADNASINIGYSKEEVSAINRSIRTLLAQFEHSSYVGYTATPFANIFIDPDTDDEMLNGDLFPRSFIYSLDTPSDYFGAEKIFLQNPDKYVVRNDGDTLIIPPKHTKNFQPTHLPCSLTEAIRAFIIATTMRSIRGQAQSHSSMMINASRLVDVQKRIGTLVMMYVSELADSCKVYSSLPWDMACSDDNLRSLHETYNNLYKNCGEKWEDILMSLWSTVSSLEIAVLNSKSSDKLDYQNFNGVGKKVIAIGGTSLSRGLTLEGLVVSYYLRTSVMYDTLMQMGRWFGYRDGYEDLCRIYMTAEALSHFTHVAESILELRDEVMFMQSQDATPEEFGLKIRHDPNTLVITAANKMGKSDDLVVKVGLANSFVESTRLRRDTKSIDDNIAAAKKLASNLTKLVDFEDLGNGYLFRNVPYDHVVPFFQSFKNSPTDMKSDPRLIIDYIRSGKNDELAMWDIYFPSIERGDVTSRLVEDLTGSLSIVCQRRTMADVSDENTIESVKRRIGSRGVESVALTKRQEVEAEKFFDEHFRKEEKQSYPDWCYRLMRTRPLLVVHLLEFNGGNPCNKENKPVVAWSASFPDAKRKVKTVMYKANTIYQRELQKHFGDSILDDSIIERERCDY